jgi:hypothetical protein
MMCHVQYHDCTLADTVKLIAILDILAVLLVLVKSSSSLGSEYRTRALQCDLGAGHGALATIMMTSLLQ